MARYKAVDEPEECAGGRSDDATAGLTQEALAPNVDASVAKAKAHIREGIRRVTNDSPMA